MAEHTPDYLQTHTIAGDQLSFSLDEQATALLRDLKPGARSAVTLLKDQGTSVVLMGMAGGNVLAEHHAPGVVTIQVLQGHVNVTHGDNAVDAPAHTLVTFAAGERHSVEAREESVLLLTLAPPGE